MNLSIILFDQTTNRLAGAKLVIAYKMPNGKPWKSGSLTAGANGVVSFQMDRAAFNQVDFRKAIYVITYQGKGYRASVSRAPTLQSPQLHLNAQGLSVSAKEPVKPEVPGKRTLELQLTFQTEDGTLMRKTPLTLVTTLKGKTLETDLGVTDNNGFLDYTTTLIALGAAWKADPRIVNTATGETFRVVGTDGKPDTRTVLKQTWILRSDSGVVSGDDDKDPAPGTRKGRVEGTLLIDNAPAKRRNFSLVWYRQNGLRMEIPLPRTDDTGTFRWEGEIALAAEAAARRAKLYDDNTLRVFEVEKTEEAQRDDLTFTFTWHIRDTGEVVEDGPDLDGGEQGLISGTITASGGQPQARMIVRAFDIDFPEEEELGRTETDDGGFYAINYAAGTALSREKDALDIVVRVYEPGSDDAARPVMESKLVERASTRLTQDIVTGAKVYPGASLYERIQDAVGEALKGAPIRNLTPASVALLAARTRFGKDELGRFILAWGMAFVAQLKATDRTAAAPFFGWLTDGLPAHPVALALQPPDKLAASLKRAVAANWIPALNYKPVLDMAQSARAGIIAEHQPDLLAYLTAGNLSNEQARTVIEVFLEGLDAAARTEALLTRLDGNKGNRALELIEIWRALGGNTRLGTQIVKSRAASVPRDLAELSVDAMTDHIKQAQSVPDHIDGATQNARARKYATQVVTGIETRYPIAFFAHQLTLMEFNETRRLGNRLKTALQMQPVRAGAADPVIIDGWDQELVDLASLYSSAVPARRAPLVDQLIRNSYMKAPDITQKGRSNFRDAMAGKFATVGEAADADSVFTRAQMIVSLANAVKMQQITEQAPGETVPKTLTRQLFQGSINSTCDHCQSMTGPAAYLLDLVRFVGRAAVGSGATGWDRVDQRRPDLKNIDLTCANSDVPMPYIDLVLELLEDQLAPWTDGPRQTVADEATLAERPYYLNAKAYNQLRTRSFPWIAQYHRDFDLTDRALQQAGLALPALKEAVAAGGSAATLGAWGKDVLTLETQNGKIAAAMGVAKLADLKRHKTVAALAGHLVIDAKDLLELLQSPFVNPDGSHLIARDHTLDWDKMDAPLIARLALLGRLRITSGLPLSDLEHWLDLANPATEGWQDQIAAGLRLADRLRLGASDLGILLSMSPEDRQSELSALCDLPEAVLERIKADSGFDTGTLDGLDQAVWLIEVITDKGQRSAGELLALIDLPSDGGPFDPTLAAETATTLVKTLSEALPDTGVASTSEQILLISETLSGQFGVDAATLAALLPDHPLLSELQAGGAATETMLRLWKQAVAVTLLDFGPDDIAGLPGLSSKFGLLNLAALPVLPGETAGIAALATMTALADLNARLYRGDGSLLARLAQTTAQLTSLRTALALPGLDATALAPLLQAKGLALSKTADLFDARKLTGLETLISACLHLSTDGATVLSLINGHDGETAWSLVKTKAGPAAWPAMARQISDPMRERARDALLAAVIKDSRSGSGPKFLTPDDVYAHFLIDPQMMAVVDTSRIKQAAASIQQFVQRVQLGLEPGVVFSQNDASQWVWRRNYRVWEANRKVMVFPENWIRPELRDNKTDLYKQLESDLMKSEVRSDTVEDALLTYARGLHDVAGLEMVALHEDDETGTTYVVGRTRENPHSYFVNARGTNGLWTGWTAIDIEIEGDHIIPVVYARRLFLAWVSYETKIAVDDDAYMERISALESEQNFVRDEIDATKRKVSEIENKQEENAKYLEKWDEVAGGEIMEAVYQNIDTAYTALLSELRGDIPGEEGGKLGDLRAREQQLIRDVNSLKQRYTYCEATLSISQRRRNGGWDPIRKSASTVRTILENDGILDGLSDEDKTVFYSQIDQFHVRTHLTGQDLTFTLCRSYDDFHEADERTEQVFGSFQLDVVNNVLVANEVHGLNTAFKTAVVKSGHVRKQTLTLRPGETTLTVLDHGDVRLLSGVSNSAARVVPQRYAHGTSLIFEQEQRSYLVEKSTFGIQPHAADTQDISRADRIEVETPLIPEGGMNLPGVAMAGDEKWQFTPLYHPFSEIVVTELYRHGLDGLYLPDAASGQPNAQSLTRQRARRDNFGRLFSPSPQVAEPWPVESISFDRTNPFGVYNWELFFHAPFAIAEALRQNRRFEEARRWYHFVFNPIDKGEQTLASVWRFGPFYREHKRILNGDTPDLMDEATNPDFPGQVEEWEQNPFNPHAVARLRTVAYMRAIYMAYLENLMDWGDDLFRRDTMESINEAAQLYVLAADLLGTPPVDLPEIDDGTPPLSVGEALSWTPSIDRILAAAGTVQPHPDNQAAGSAFFDLFGDFCMPSNDKLAGLWSRLADRLFKIRNSLNIDGTFRKLALYQPPIDPALLVKAAASGLSIADAVAGLSARRPLYRFTFMVAKALEFTADVRSLGASLLAALEKRDAEALSRLRASHEVAMNRQMRAAYQDRIKEAELTIASHDAELTRFTQEELYYEALILNGNLFEEKMEDFHLKVANDQTKAAGVWRGLAAIASLVPQVGSNGAMPAFRFGGIHVAGAFNAFGAIHAQSAQQNSFDATMAGRTAGRIRRGQDWVQAKERAAAEIKRVQQNRLAAEIRLAIAEKDLEQHDLRSEQAKEAETFLRDKFTGEALYSWMVDRLSALHFQAYKLASDMAAQAQTCYRDELSDDTASFLEPGAWDSLHKGLLAGEQLTLDLRRMEAAYLANNTRPHELTKSVSLAQLDPLALIALRSDGECQFTLPEMLFDLDHAGHLNRRIKSVNITIPALAGPQTGITATLSLVESHIRRVTSEGETSVAPSRAGETMAMSTGQNDSGMFQFDFRDPRYLKFEGAGAVSTWTVTLPDPALAQFDYGSISDLVIQIHYTAEDGPETHRRTVLNTLRGALGTVDQPARTLFSLRYDFPESWARLKNDPALTALSLTFDKDRFPYLYANRQIEQTHLTMVSVAGQADDVVIEPLPVTGNPGHPVEVALPQTLRVALDGTARDILLVTEFTAGPA